MSNKKDIFLDLVRIVFISLEFLSLILGAFLYFYLREFCELIGETIMRNNNIAIYIPTITLIGISYKLGQDLLRPLGDKSNKILLEWPDYNKLKMRAYLSIICCSIFGITELIMIFLSNHIKSGLLGCLVITFTMIILFCLFTMFLAKMKIKELLDLTDANK